MSDKKSIPIEIFAGTAMQAHIVKSLLENAEIEAFLKDEYIGSLTPWHAAPGGAGAVKVYISSLDHEKAMIVIRDYEDNLSE